VQQSGRQGGVHRVQKCKSADCSGGGTQQDSREYRWWERSGNVSQPRYTGVGAGMIEMPATALTQTGCFDVQKRAELENMDIRVVDIRRARIIASKTFQANNGKNGFGISTLGWGGGTVLGGSHASISGSPLEEVARDLLVRSTSFLTETIAARNISGHVMVSATDVSAK
jgi:curli biogenesis system outer membrane secretion channel CsgG